MSATDVLSHASAIDWPFICHVKCMNNDSSYSMHLCLGGTGRQEVLVLNKPDDGAGSRWLQHLLLSLRLGRDTPPLKSNTETKSTVHFPLTKRKLPNNITVRITNVDEFYCLVLSEHYAKSPIFLPSLSITGS